MNIITEDSENIPLKVKLHIRDADGDIISYEDIINMLIICLFFESIQISEPKPTQYVQMIKLFVRLLGYLFLYLSYEVCDFCNMFEIISDARSERTKNIFNRRSWSASD